MSSYFAPCMPGFEAILADEVRAAGAEPVPTQGGVHFQTDPPVAWALCLWSRVAVRVLEELNRGTVKHQNMLYAFARRVPWHRLMHPDQTIAVFTSIQGSPIRHSRYAAQRVKDAVADRMREELGRRPSVDRDAPDVPIKLVLRGTRARLYRDLAGEPLHKRGWRSVPVKSPLEETTAAGLIQLSGWDRTAPLIDPMCGSGTFLIEAAHLAGDRAPGLHRPFSFERWSDFDPELWSRLRTEAAHRAEAGRVDIGRLEGADVHAGAVRIARRSIQEAGLEGRIDVRTCAVADLVPTTPPGWVLVNPPWGRRLDEAEASWSDLGRFLKTQCAGAEAWVLSGERALTRHLRLKASGRVPVQIARVDCRFLHYQIRARPA